mmetsp:Transcript_49228/g.126992  ORF Transcript_49228/g.126992 Transcript_49228/m.126992 type:complete len:187 (-) Transcript_49228:246-806(-)|eukprot:CAMPEP_0113897200 /NCGR_PEP_ID=MMETSP0780_2-20120614/18524_1 /TAXON_ID=652834 /ORGANISM="Palpitomonas bilix" /LENGTH=186 /DNA_ID=CAMNT_0000888591 /DNA_START=76 /DNA_END=636 /DNA_ORIENTATION=- /assembly_acc=CAM_ASM_000599
MSSSSSSSQLDDIKRLADALAQKSGPCTALYSFQVFRSFIDDEVIAVAMSAVEEMDMRSRAKNNAAVNQALDRLLQEKEERKKIDSGVPSSPPTTSKDAKAEDPHNMKVVCKKCNQKLAATKFAPHLVKCFGGGRAAARSAMKTMKGEEAGDYDSDDNTVLDDEWGSKKKKAKKKIVPPPKKLKKE